MKNSVIVTAKESRLISEGKVTAFIDAVNPQPNGSDVCKIGGTNTYSIFESGDVLSYNSPYNSGSIIYLREPWIGGFEMDDGCFKTDEHGELIPNTWYKSIDYNLQWFEDSDWSKENVPWESGATMPKSAARVFVKIVYIKYVRVREVDKQNLLTIFEFKGDDYSYYEDWIEYVVRKYGQSAWDNNILISLIGIKNINKNG